MKLNELRFGNWIEYKYGYKTKVSEIKQWEAEDVYFMLEYQDKSEDDVQPIPLTPEILEKCGFTFTGYMTERGYMTRLYHKSIVSVKYDTMTNEYNPKYTHQLQNLYFALTGEELNIEL